MHNVIIGTAGHIDHGKTTLIRALTGRDTDRLEEEKRRGITIDLGFTWFDLPDGGRAGIIDVPGHERFIHNMAAGVAGMDLVLLVIAADEGVMPQTREHMDILSLLGVEHYIIVLNKCDLVDGEWLDMVKSEIREEMQETALKDAPVVRVSASDGSGVETLKKEIVRMAEQISPRSGAGRARLPVDRVFSVPGFGTVVTGTLLGGRIRKGDSLCLYPAKSWCRVRGIQVYQTEQEECAAGQRAALNLSGVSREEVRRGCVLASEDTIRSGRNIDVKLSVLKNSGRVIKNQTRLHFYSGTSELLCRAVLLDREELMPGESGYAQLRMESDTALCPGDRFVVRFYSPLETIGGGVILETDAPRERRFRAEVLERLRRREEGGEKELVELQIRKHGKSLISAEELAAETGVERSRIEPCVLELQKEGRIFAIETKGERFLWHADEEKEVRNAILAEMEEYLARYPYRRGVPASGFRGTLLACMKKTAAEVYVESLIQAGVIGKQGDVYFPAGYRPREDRDYCAVKEKLTREAERAGYSFVSGERALPEKMTEEQGGEILRLLTEQGAAAEVVPGIYTLPEYMERAEREIGKKLDETGKITVVQVRDLFGTSRKCAKQILDYTDRRGLTRKDGAETERVKNR